MKYRMEKMKKRTTSNRTLVLAIALVLVLGCGVMGTLMFLVDKTSEVKNTFSPSAVTCKVTEDFDGSIKKKVNVTNTSDINAYIRVKRVTYRVNAAGEKIGGVAAIPSFKPGDGWFEKDGFYYYSKPVAPDGVPEEDLIGEDGITLVSSYTDSDGGRQVIEVIAEAIQSVPADAVEQAWNVTVTDGSISKGI